MQETPPRLESGRLYVRAQAAIQQMIDSGVYDIDQQLPPEWKLAEQLGVSRPTVRMALGRLESLGMVVRVQGGGTFVTRRNRPTLDFGLETIQSLHPHMSAESGLLSQIRDLDICRVEADAEIAERLGVQPGAAVVRVARVVVVGDEPAAYLCDYIPDSIVTLEELQQGFADSVLDFFANRPGPKLSYAKSDIFIYLAEADTAACLGVEEGEALFQIDEAFFTARDELIDWSCNYFVPKHFRFHLVRRVVS